MAYQPAVTFESDAGGTAAERHANLALARDRYKDPELLIW